MTVRFISYRIKLRKITTQSWINKVTSFTNSNPVSVGIKFPVYVYNFKLFDFIDELSDLSCLVYQKNSQTYLPYNKDWVKEKIYILLRNQAGKNWLPNSFYALNLIISKISAVLFMFQDFAF